MIAGEVMDAAAVLLNDRAKLRYTYLLQIPLLKLALQELADELTDNGAPRLQKAAAINVAALALLVTPPADLDSPISLQEKDQNATDDTYWPMQFWMLLPSRTMAPTLQDWSFQNNVIGLVGATVAKTVKLDYYVIPTAITDENSTLAFNNALNFLSYRTAELAARSVGGAAMQIRADWLSNEAAEYLDRYVAVRVKQTQSATACAAGYDEGN